MPYNELTKHFNNVRKYLKEFYVYGLKSKSALIDKSSRSYDNERRRIESWLGLYMDYTISNKSKIQNITIDSRENSHNPFFSVFGAKSFTDSTIIIFFCLFDLLEDFEWISLDDIVLLLYTKYFDNMNKEILIDRRTIATKVESYVKEGLILQKKVGKKYLYKKNESTLDLLTLKDCVNFFSEITPLGVIGSFISNNISIYEENKLYTKNNIYKINSNNKNNNVLWFKHHYLLFAIDSEIIEQLLEAIQSNKSIQITTYSQKNKNNKKNLFPIKIYISTQTGRQHLLAYSKEHKKMIFIRIDNIQNVSIGIKDKHSKTYIKIYENIKPYLWGVSIKNYLQIEHLSMIINIEKHEQYILQRLIREKRNGTLEKLSETQYKYSVDTFDTQEMIPWIRTFIGRISDFQCSNPTVYTIFKRDLEKMYKIYEI